MQPANSSSKQIQNKTLYHLLLSKLSQRSQARFDWRQVTFLPMSKNELILNEKKKIIIIFQLHSAQCKALLTVRSVPPRTTVENSAGNWLSGSVWYDHAAIVSNGGTYVCSAVVSPL